MMSPRPHPSILVIAPNSAIDEVFRVPGLALGGAARVTRRSAFAGGKGANAAHAAALLGARAALVGFAGGSDGASFRELLAARGVADATVPFAGATRRTFCFLDAGGATPTLVVEEGAAVTRTEVARFAWSAAQALGAAPRPGALVLAGSVPPGFPPRLFADLVVGARERGVPAVVDSHGAPLVAAAGASPACLSVNAAELAELTRLRGAAAEPALVRAARRWIESGVGAVCVKRGERGLLLITARGAWRAVAPVVRGNATGSGDVVTAHLAVALARRVPLHAILRAAAGAAAANVRRDEPATFARAAARELARATRVVRVSG